ncbi:MAG TPA: acryloyl-CoA reductase [Gaiellales bacterium]|jgi:putative YhdH/YhfP family quinone oxidoreductase
MSVPERFDAVVVDHERNEPVAVRQLTHSDLTGDLLIEVGWASLNYKDALASRPDGQVARLSPLVLGVDQAGIVRESDDPRLAVGDAVLAHGRALGVSHHGGFASWSRLPADWAVPLPAGLGAREAMILGTAGFTAAASILALERHGVLPSAGPVLVTGATGGVGSAAVAMLRAHGYTVHASTGKPDAADWLRELGASEVIGRDAVTANAARPLAKQIWAAAVDSVGGATLAGALAATQYGGAIAASGVTGGARLDTTVMPFILRNVSLLGIDSAAMQTPERAAIWERIATDLRPARLELLVARQIELADVVPALDELLAGRARGRFVVRVGG